MEKLLSLIKASPRALKNCFKIEFTSLHILVFLYIAIRAIIDGIEEFLILPTAWYYIGSFGQSNVFLGATLAAYSIGALFFAPCFGMLDDRFQAPKTILLVCGFTKFSGNLLYSIPVSAYFPLFGRLISGIAEGSVGVLYGVVVKCTDIENRQKVFILFEGLFVLGTVLAPTIGSFLTFDFNILGWKIGTGNSPGFILAIVWFLLIILTIILPRNLACDELSPSEEDQLDFTSNDENFPERKPISIGSTPKQIDSKIACIYFIIFMAIFVYCATSFYTPLLAVDRFNLQLIHVKLLFLNGTLVMFVFYLSTYLVTDYFSEITLIVVSIAMEFFAISFLLYFTFSWNNASSGNEGYILLIFICVGMPCFSFPLACSLLSKVTDLNNAAFYQSLSFTVAHLAIIFGRMIAGATFNKTSLMFTTLGIFFFWLVQVIWLYMEYRNLKPVQLKG